MSVRTYYTRKFYEIFIVKAKHSVSVRNGSLYLSPVSLSPISPPTVSVAADPLSNRIHLLCTDKDTYGLLSLIESFHHALVPLREKSHN